MPRPDLLPRFSSARGVLLVEAVLASVVVAVGLSFITRGLGSQVQAFGAMEEYDTLARLADDVLGDIQRDAQAGHPPRRAPAGTFEAPDAAYRWTISAAPLPSTDPDLSVARVTVRIARADGTGRAQAVEAVWPTELVPQEWL